MESCHMRRVHEIEAQGANIPPFLDSLFSIRKENKRISLVFFSLYISLCVLRVIGREA